MSGLVLGLIPFPIPPMILLSSENKLLIKPFLKAKMYTAITELNVNVIFIFKIMQYLPSQDKLQILNW